MESTREMAVVVLKQVGRLESAANLKVSAEVDGYVTVAEAIDERRSRWHRIEIKTGAVQSVVLGSRLGADQPNTRNAVDKGHGSLGT